MRWAFDALASLSRWTDRAPWRSWVLHGVLAAPLCLLVGPWATAVFYLLRELEQIAHQEMFIRQLAEPPHDYVFDVLVPWAVAAAWVWRAWPTLG